MYVLALSDYKQPAAAAGYKPAPQLDRQMQFIFTTLKIPYSPLHIKSHERKKCSERPLL